MKKSYFVLSNIRHGSTNFWPLRPRIYSFGQQIHRKTPISVIGFMQWYLNHRDQGEICDKSQGMESPPPPVQIGLRFKLVKKLLTPLNFLVEYKIQANQFDDVLHQYASVY